MGMPCLLCWNSKMEGVRTGSRLCKARAGRGFGWVGGWMDRWIDGWMDGWMDR